MNYFDVIVVGAGHSGMEAANAARKQCKSVGLVTFSKENIGQLSCNPSIGGIGKGNVVREVDVLGGLMAKFSDYSCIHKRILNQKKGPAVWGIRHQVDRGLYKQIASKTLNNTNGITIVEGCGESVIVENSSVKGLIVSGVEFFCKSLVITSGTFLNGKMQIGKDISSGGRINEKSATDLSISLKSLGLNMGRMKTGTPCRLAKDSINFSNLIEQESDLEAGSFSFFNNGENVNKHISCHITKTNSGVRDLIMDASNREFVPAVSGKVSSKGPRYCPSIEDKTLRFTHNTEHQIFLEPEGFDSNLIYPAGISTSMSKDLQEKMMSLIDGLEDAKIMQYGYVIEYDFVHPKECKMTLETKKIKNLFLAGQLIGTTGYEEAAGLGIVAGINAALKASGCEEEFILDRASSYIGTMIDDLTKKNLDDGEPYRLYTSRSEYRLSVRSDNADRRLVGFAEKLNLLDDLSLNKLKIKLKKVDEFSDILKSIYITPSQLAKYDIKIRQDGVKRSLFDLLKNNITISDIKNKLSEVADLTGLDDKNVIEAIEIDAKYFFYMQKQEKEIEDFRHFEGIVIPDDFDFRSVKSLSNEIVEKMQKNKPNTIGESLMISGVTHSALIDIVRAIQAK